LQFHATAITTFVAVMVYFWMATRVAVTRRKTGILAPVMVGDPKLERTIRAHTNTMEWLPIFLPSLWLFAVYWGDRAAAVVGAIWIIGRIVYFFGYVAEARRRFAGFFVQAVAVSILVLGGLGRVLYVVAAEGR
jgi:glutathione S-transferase